METAKAIKQALVLTKHTANESHDGMTIILFSTFGLVLHMLCAWGTFNISTSWEYWIDGKFLMNHLCLLPAVLLLSFSRKFLSILPLLAFREIALSSLTWRSTLFPEGCNSNKDARDRFMRLQLRLTPGTSAPVLTQEKDNHSKVNRIT